MQLRLEARSYALPFRTPVNTAHGPWSLREGMLLCLSDCDGRRSFADLAPIPWFGMPGIDAVKSCVASLGEVWSGEHSPDFPPELAFVGSRLHEAAESLLAASTSTSSSEFLPVAGLLPAGKACLRRAAELLDLGFRTFKWKVGVGDDADERVLLDDLLGLLPASAKLRLDANGAWDGRRAQRWLAYCSERPLDFVEQPVAHDSPKCVDLLLGLASDFPTPLALDEAVVADSDVSQWLDLGWPGIFVLKPSLLGDPDGCLNQLSKRGAPFVLSSALETRIGARRLLELAFRQPSALRPLGIGVWPLFADGRFDGPHIAPFVRRADMEGLNLLETWNALP